MDKTLEYIYKGISYKVHITYKRMKYITFRFRKGAFVVSSPKRVKDEEILKGIEKYAEKLLKQNKRNEGTDGNGFYLFGVYVPYNLEKKVYFNDGTSIEYKDKEDLDKKIKKLFLKCITPRVRYYEKMMNIRNPYKVKVKSMTSRFGSNSSRTRSVSFSMILSHYSFEIIDAVIVHELAHDYLRNHSKKFYDIVIKYYPSYYENIKKLNKGVFK